MYDQYTEFEILSEEVLILSGYFYTFGFNYGVCLYFVLIHIETVRFFIYLLYRTKPRFLISGLTLTEGRNGD